MAQEIITIRESLVSSTVGGTAIVSPEVFTAEMFNQTIILGATIGFWLALLGCLSLLIVLILNIKRFYIQILKPLFNKEEINLDG